MAGKSRSNMSGEERMPEDPGIMHKVGAFLADVKHKGAARAMKEAVGASEREKMAAKHMKQAGQELKKNY